MQNGYVIESQSHKPFQQISCFLADISKDVGYVANMSLIFPTKKTYALGKDTSWNQNNNKDHKNWWMIWMGNETKWTIFYQSALICAKLCLLFVLEQVKFVKSDSSVINFLGNYVHYFEWKNNRQSWMKLYWSVCWPDCWFTFKIFIAQ